MNETELRAKLDEYLTTLVRAIDEAEGRARRFGIGDAQSAFELGYAKGLEKAYAWLVLAALPQRPPKDMDWRLEPGEVEP
jgi:hypothetical protein